MYLFVYVCVVNHLRQIEVFVYSYLRYNNYVVENRVEAFESNRIGTERKK